jgi:predicted tellurium resistance membrane protein TerC
MMFSAKPIGDFVDAHPIIKMLVLSRFILVSVTLVTEGLHFHIPKGCDIYFVIGDYSSVWKCST